MLELLAQEAAPAGSGTEQAPFWTNPLVPILVVGIVFWFVLLQPQRKQEKARREKLEALKKGDRVLTRGGLYGEVRQVKGDVVLLSIDRDGRVHAAFQKTAIEDVVPSDADIDV
mgnify:CR=1 FL=1